VRPGDDRLATGWARVYRAHPAALALAGIALLGSGCPRHLPIARVYPPPTAAELTAVLRARQEAVVSMSARVRATSWLGGDRVRATVLMLVDRQGRLRFEAEVSLQGTVAVLATDGRHFAFLDTMKNELRSGPACPANVASLIRIPLGPADVAAILLGDARLPGDSGANTDASPADSFVDWDGERGADVLAVSRNDGWLRLLFQRWDSDPHHFRLLGAVATARDGRARWRVAYEDFTDATVPPPAAGGTAAPPDGVLRASLPRTIRFAEGDTSFDEGVEIKFKERSLNQPASWDAFMVTPAPGTKIVDVGCPG
jgi:hypothetical protein